MFQIHTCFILKWLMQNIFKILKHWKLNFASLCIIHVRYSTVHSVRKWFLNNFILLIKSPAWSVITYLPSFLRPFCRPPPCTVWSWSVLWVETWWRLSGPKNSSVCRRRGPETSSDNLYLPCIISMKEG